ncbi:hypothetical protein S245_048094, partial [Arachis hypogaea]
LSASCALLLPSRRIPLLRRRLLHFACKSLSVFAFLALAFIAVAIVAFQPLGRRCRRCLPPVESSLSEALQSPTSPLRLQFEKVIILFWASFVDL